MRVFRLPEGASPREQGRAHGETFRHEIAELSDLRTELTVLNGRFRDRGSVRAAAELHLPVLASFDAALYDELLGIADGAGLTPADVVVLNHYTDLKDVDPDAIGLGRRGASPVGLEEDCSAVYARTPEGPVLAQTWDMHGSASPYVCLVQVPARGDEPAAWLFTLTGCLGMTGLNAAGVGLTINNLRCHDARVGVVWPALVRRALRETTAEAARDVILGARLGSGHHYLVASSEAAFGIETSGTRSAVVHADPNGTYVHTNHCLDAGVGECSSVAPESTTHARFDILTRSFAEAPPTGRDDVWRRLGNHEGYPRSVCTHLGGPGRPHAMLTCGAVAMDLDAADLWATSGCVHHALPTWLDFDPGEDA